MFALQFRIIRGLFFCCFFAMVTVSVIRFAVSPKFGLVFVKK